MQVSLNNAASCILHTAQKQQLSLFKKQLYTQPNTDGLQHNIMSTNSMQKIFYSTHLHGQ